MNEAFATVLFLSIAGLFVWFVVALWIASGKIAKKGLGTMDAVQRIDQRMEGWSPPDPRSRVD